MRLLVLSDLWLPFPGGAERLMFNLSRDLVRRGHDVAVLTGYDNARAFDGPPVCSAPIGVFETHAQGESLVRGFVDTWRPEVIITHHLYARQFGETLATMGVPVVQVVLNGKRMKDAAFAVCISRHVAERADCELLDMIITPPAFDDVIADTHDDRIGFIKPIEHKGIEMFYAIAERLPTRRFLVLRGEWQHLEVIRPLPNVAFLEPVVDIRDFYRLVSIMLVPSRSEDAGTVAQEATLNGLPCISSNVDGLAETNAGGILLDRDDVDGWVAAIEQLDVLTNYAMVVQRQREHLESTDRDLLLDAFERRLLALV